ncbi:MAG: DUF1992 domain-containing protein [Planctomycetota bacterium]
MTERKPIGDTWESWVDRQVREATERGAFDDLAGAGKPIQGLDEPYNSNWWLQRFLQREGLSILPDTLQLGRFVEDEKKRINKLHAETTVRRELDSLNATIREQLAQATSGPSSRTTTVDVERFVAAWRANREEP